MDYTTGLERKQANTEKPISGKSVRPQIERSSSFKYPKNVQFVCNGCALCCGDTESRRRTILLLEIEATEISRATSKRISDFAQEARGLPPYSFLMRKNDEGKCVFLDEKRCSIYQIRPLVCQFYPFELLVGDKGRYVFDYTCECPNIGEGFVVRRSFFEELFQRSRKMFNNVPLKDPDAE
jgi:Fe-S-cluster containining protein